jgi:uncharacterized protein
MKAAIAALAFATAIVASPLAHAASFDCDAKELKPDEKVICDTRALNDADVKMATTSVRRAAEAAGRHL